MGLLWLHVHLSLPCTRPLYQSAAVVLQLICLAQSKVCWTLVTCLSTLSTLKPDPFSPAWTHQLHLCNKPVINLKPSEDLNIGRHDPVSHNPRIIWFSDTFIFLLRYTSAPEYSWRKNQKLIKDYQRLKEECKEVKCIESCCDIVAPSLTCAVEREKMCVCVFMWVCVCVCV